MTETAVNFILGKLRDAAVKEVLLLRGVDKQVEKVRRELTRIEALLKDADRKRISDETQRNWVKEVRDVAYWIEDVVDSAFLLEDSTEIETPGEKTTCFSCASQTWECIQRMFRKPRKLPALHKLGEEIDQVLARIKEINESRITYGISNLGEGSGEPLSMLPIRPPVLPDFDDPDVVGLDKDTDNIVERLLDESTKRRSVVSIVGTGGLGKTTLARKAYNRSNIKSHFNNPIWVTVSKEFKLIDLLKKIIEQFRSIDPSEHEKDIEYFLSKLNVCMKGRKYLLILDNVWENHLWSYLKEALPDEKNGSRVLITTRSLDVAKEAESEPYELKFLNEESSLELLLKKALPYQNFNKDYPNDLVGLAEEFAKKCGGLPLPLLVLGGLLSKKSGYNAWHTILRTMSWSVDGRACTEVLNSSYEDLTLALKSCFMYFAMFPEDSDIYAAYLVRMWVAEGFIPEEKNRTLEDTAESFLEELVQSMKFLQTLDLRETHHGELPDCIWLVKSLRHVILGSYTSGPTPGADLRNLQTLTRVTSRESRVTGAGTPKLSNLRELRIKVVEGHPWEVVFALLGTLNLKQLTRLTLWSSDGTFKVPDTSNCTFGPHLQSLDLDLGSCHEIISLGINMFSIHLIKLSLYGLQLDQDPISILEKLPNLKELLIGRLEYHKKQMIFSGKGFVRLDFLCLFRIRNLEELEIEEGAMPMLKELWIDGCPQLRVPLGLQHLTSLKSLEWNLSDDNLASAKENEIRNLCKHVPTIVLH